jgi:beta-lactamase class A
MATAARRRRWTPVPWAVAAVIVLAVVVWQWPSLPAAPALPSIAVPGLAERRRADTAELTRRIDALVKGFSGDAAVFVADAGDPTPLYTRDEKEPVVAASLYKLAVMLHVETLIERRQLKLSDTITIADEDIQYDGSNVYPGDTITIEKALELMITLSDNGIALAFWRIYGPGPITSTAELAGFRGIVVAKAGEDNVVTARAVGELMQRMVEGKLVSQAASDRMIGRLERQTVTGRSDALLPKGTRLAHKTGELVGYFHDAAIVFTPIGPRVVVTLTWDAGEAESTALIAKIAQAAFETAR